MFALQSPAHRANAGNQTEPVCEQNEDENRGEEPEGFLYEVMADDAFQEIVKTLHQPFPEILRAGRDVLHVSSGKSRE